ncbi:MMPL family transporter [Nocardia sp. JMUB6875]|uniref:MMPL family transporter n=1 Tax=Nocardia sp. JMUB6875 TaxID=3158170 RepID=UPI0034E85311
MRSVGRRPLLLLIITFLFVLVVGAFGASVQSHLKAGGVMTSDLESQRANDYLTDHFPGGNPNLVVSIGSSDGVDAPNVRFTAFRIVSWLQQHRDVSGAQSYWTIDRPDLAQGLRSKDRKSGLVLVGVTGDEAAAQNSAGAIAEELGRMEHSGVDVRVGGSLVAQYDINKQAAEDLTSAEAIAVPLTFVALILVFGSFVAATLPVAIGVFTIVATTGILRLLTAVTDVSIFALNITTALGLALAIDYSLFIVSRFREELADGHDTPAAVERAVRTAGRTVVFSALSVALCLGTMLVFPQYFLRSFAYAGLGVVGAATGAALVILPAALLVLGDRINAWDLRKPLLRLVGRQPGSAPAPEKSRWYRFVLVVMRRAVPVTVAAAAVLLAMGAPFLSLRFGYPDDRALPESAQSRQVGDELRTDFAANFGASPVVVLPGVSDAAAVGAYAAALSKVDHVPAVLSSAGVYVGGQRMTAAPAGMVNDAGTYLSVQSTLDPYSADGAEQLRALRAVPAPGPVLIGGNAAMNRDSLDAIMARLPLALIVIAAATFVVLFLFTGSILIPLKALLLNLLSLSASYGAMVWVFQQGHFSGLLGFTPTGYINAAIPILMFCIAFGMSMDYEVFLLSRIREEWLVSDRSAAANTHAVAMGVARTGRIFTAAAGLMIIVFIGVATSRVSVMQLFGVGLSLAVLADATLIRALLVPALMRMMGTANWWLPKPLAALHDRIGLREADSADDEVARPMSVSAV